MHVRSVIISFRGGKVIPCDALKAYKESVMKFGRFVEDLFDRSVYALVDRNANMAKKVVDDDKFADEMRDKLNEDILCTIGEYAPVGKQLVESVDGFILSNTLEMMGDKAVKIALNTLELLKEPALKPLVDLPKMASTTENMIRKSLEVYMNQRNLSAVNELIEMEESVDELNVAIEDELKLYMMKSPKNVGRALKLIFISHQIENVADLCLKVLPKTR